MHLIETYSASCGLQVDRPEIYEKFFALPFEKYIVLHAGGGMGSKQYEYYPDVISMLRPILDPLDINIVQIGAKNDPFVNQTVDLRGATSIHQTAYLIKHCRLFLGNDSCNLHIASGYDVPIVGLYGSTTSYNHGPYFSSEGKTVLITGDLKGNKPSYSPQEDRKVVNSIKPEEVVKAVIKLLGIDIEVKRESIFFGKQYQYYNLDLIPDSILHPEVFREITPTLRMDLEFNEDYMAANLRNRPFHVLSDKPISVDLLKHYKRNITNLIYELKDGYDVDFIDQIRKAGVNYILFTLEQGDFLSKAKLDFFDHGIIIEAEKRGKEIIEQYPQITKESKYRTNKFLLSKDKIYLNKFRWREDKPVPHFTENTDTVTLEEEFFNYSDHFYVFNE